MAKKKPVTRVGRHRLPAGGGRKPPAAVQRELKAHDRHASVKWNNATQRYQVWRKGEKTGRNTLVKTIQNRDGSYREPGADTVRDLRRGDTRRMGGVNAVERKFRQTYDRDKELRRKKREDDVGRISRERFHQVAGNAVVGSTPAYRDGYELAFGGGR